ncbi:lysine--tRNA ligase [Candidatus Saccharibacteria bacterium RIFCSPHIGHO2_12_FULL_47_16b]|nr:MAG: lysine--tRNA ligase [Candidatus Saccharibacteria bacterium RIFCSPHIGHO2_12_FULL_47_16b]
MKWLAKIVDEVGTRQPKGEVLIESGASPSGAYHFGHLREIITCDAIRLELIRRGRQAKHIHYVDDLDALRKIPANVPAEFEKYLGQALCDIPAPDGSKSSYGEFFLADFLKSAKVLGVEMEVIRSHEKYRAGFFTAAIEKSLADEAKIRQILETVSGHKLDDHWSPLQVIEETYLKNRKFLAIDEKAKTLDYEDAQGKTMTISYAHGQAKLNWRIDWPARWWLLKIAIEPAGRDHASAGGSFDTGLAIIKEIFGQKGPIPVPYDFVNRAGDTKKMSASAGTGISATEVVKVLPPEVVRYFMLRFPPSKRLYFDEQNIDQLIDEFAGLAAAEPDSPLVQISLNKLERVVSNVPFSHLVAAYQSALKDIDKTIDIIKRASPQPVDEAVVKKELKYIDGWLKNWAPESIKFELSKAVKKSDFSEPEMQFLSKLADAVAKAPKSADGEWFHKAIYQLEFTNLDAKAKFETLYKALIGKTSGPRAGWFLSILPRDWLIKRLRFEA